MKNIFKSCLPFLIMLCLYLSCSQKLTPLKEDYVEPKGFWYFDPEFHLDSFETKLRTDGLYFRILEEDSFGDNYQMFRFYQDGLVLEYSVYNTPDKVVKILKSKAGNIHGYFKVDRDSVFFTTKVYYDHHPTFYKGQIFKDSIVLHSENYHKKVKASGVYYFFKE